MSEIVELFGGYEIISGKLVKDHKTSGAVYLPKKFVGREVIILLKKDKEDGKQNEGRDSEGRE